MYIMENEVLTYVPSGGLANRMRAIASAYSACRRAGSRLHIVWFRDWALNAPFCEIFEPIDGDFVSLREARPLDIIVNDRPRRRNLWLPGLFQRMAYRRRIDERDVTPLKRAGFDFAGWMRGHRCWMSCYQVFGDFPDGLYPRLFRPVADIRADVETAAARFSAHTVGMHIRRTDNAESIEKSPTRLFIEAGLREMAEYPDLMIYLATDSEDVKRMMCDEFGRRVITPSVAACRGDVAGIRGGLVDMYALSRTCRIYGSAGSSFSVMAAALGETELKILKI